MRNIILKKNENIDIKKFTKTLNLNGRLLFSLANTRNKDYGP